jgi:hypothetical protein
MEQLILAVVVAVETLQIPVLLEALVGQVS